MGAPYNEGEKMRKLQIVKDGFYFLRDGKVVREVRRIRTPVKGTNGEECKLSLRVTVEKLKRNLKRYSREVRRKVRIIGLDLEKEKEKTITVDLRG